MKFIRDRMQGILIPNSFIFNLLRELVEDTVSTSISRNQKQPRFHTLYNTNNNTLIIKKLRRKQKRGK